MSQYGTCRLLMCSLEGSPPCDTSRVEKWERSSHLFQQWSWVVHQQRGVQQHLLHEHYAWGHGWAWWMTRYDCKNYLILRWSSHVCKEGGWFVVGWVSGKMVLQSGYREKNVIPCSKDHRGTKLLCHLGPRKVKVCRGWTIPQCMILENVRKKYKRDEHK